MYKNIVKKEKVELKNLVAYQEGQVVSKTLVQNDYVSVTLFSFDKGEEISTHASGGDAMVTVLEGTGKFTIGGDVFILKEGETIIMPKDVPHAVYGQEKFKMERPGLLEIGDKVQITEFQSYMNYSYIIEPAVAMSGCYPNAERIRSRKGIVKNIEHTPRGFIVTAEFDE